MSRNPAKLGRIEGLSLPVPNETRLQVGEEDWMGPVVTMLHSRVALASGGHPMPSRPIDCMEP